MAVASGFVAAAVSSYRLPAEQVAEAGLTEKQRQAVEMKVGLGWGYTRIGLALGIQREGAREHLRKGLLKLERVTRQEAENG